MIRLHIVVEGQTEETFVRDILAPHLIEFQIYADARCVETKRTPTRKYRGGLSSYIKVKKDITLWMKEDKSENVYFTTMFDLFRLPNDFPGYDDAQKKADVFLRAEHLEEQFSTDIEHPRNRFIPYFQIYEFEALLLSNPAEFNYAFPLKKKNVNILKSIKDTFQSPEHINDKNPPSKRIMALFEEYDKVVDGPIIVEHIGLETIRKECCHFNSWIEKLEILDV